MTINHQQISGASLFLCYQVTRGNFTEKTVPGTEKEHVASLQSLYYVRPGAKKHLAKNTARKDLIKQQCNKVRWTEQKKLGCGVPDGCSLKPLIFPFSPPLLGC